MGWGKSSLTEEKKKGEGGKKRHKTQTTTTRHNLSPRGDPDASLAAQAGCDRSPRRTPPARAQQPRTARPGDNRARRARPGLGSPAPAVPPAATRGINPLSAGQRTDMRTGAANVPEGRYKITSVVLLRGKVLQIPLGFSPPLSQSARKEPQKKPGVDYPPKVQ